MTRSRQESGVREIRLRRSMRRGWKRAQASTAPVLDPTNDTSRLDDQVRLRGGPMAQVLIRNWWALALRGVFGILFGLAAFLFPGITLGALILLFAIYAVLDGMFAIVAAIRAAEHHERWRALLLDCIAGIAAGVLAFVWPALTAVVLLYLIAGWSIITGALEIAARSEEHTSELQSPYDLVCRLLLEKKKNKIKKSTNITRRYSNTSYDYTCL